MQNKKTHAVEGSPARMRSGTPSQQRLEKLRAEANSCALMSRSEANSAKRELFRRLAEELAIEALELEQIVKDQQGR
jgi:hypothetical protein